PALPKGLGLVLIGKEILPIPSHPRITHLGFLDDADKFDALAAADLLIMPSYYESLSMVALEAWALGKPVLANGNCEVLRGQCIRSRAGLYYDNQAEFVETLRAIADSRTLNAALGSNGRAFFNRHYSWPVIEPKYRDILEASDPQNILIHHFSIGSRASRIAYAVPDRQILVYHNITPPQFFIDVHEQLAEQCFKGRRELGIYPARVDLALGDSEFNRQELEALGFAPTGVLPVVPDFSHLDLEPNDLVAGELDDEITNIVFVGRII